MDVPIHLVAEANLSVEEHCSEILPYRSDFSDVSHGIHRRGGGAYYFEGALRSLFKKRLVVPENPEFANAGGCAKLAQYYLQREQQRV